MFRITEDPSSESLVQCSTKNYKNDFIMSVDMDVVGVMAAYSESLCMCVVHCIGRHIQIYFPVLDDFKWSDHPPTSRSKIKKKVELYLLYLCGMLWGDHSCQPILIYNVM